MDSELLATLIEAISALNQRANDLEVENDGTKKEINEFESSYAKEKKLLHDRIDAISVQIYSLVKEEVGKIPTPTNGKDFDEDLARGLITAQMSKYIKQKDIDIKKVETNLKQEFANYISDIQKEDEEIRQQGIKELKSLLSA